MLGLDAVGAIRMPLGAHLSYIFICRSPLWNLRRRRILLACHLLSAAGAAAPFGVSGVWGASVPSMHPYVLPWNSVALEVHSRGFSHLGQLFNYGGVSAPRRLNSPSHSLATPPPGFFTTLEALPPPSLSPTPEDSPASFSCRTENFSLLIFPTHGGLLLPLRPRPRRWRPRWRPRRPLCPLVHIPRRFPPITLPLPSDSFRPPLTPLRSRPPPPTLTPPSPLRST